MPTSRTVRTPFLWLLAIAAFTVMVQGYHLGVDDAAIYIPGIKQAADPSLYPFGAQFFQNHARLSVFPLLVGGPARLLGLPIDLVIFAWYVAGILLLLMASWRLLCACFETDSARWGGLALLASTLAVPVAGTALAIGDPYVTSRTISTPATLFAIACYVAGQRKQAFAWWVVTMLVHPQMGVYTAVFLGCLVVSKYRASIRAAALAPTPGLACLSVFPFLFEFQPARGAAREALFSRTFFFLSQWTWYEWVGVFAPLALLGWFSFIDLRGTKPAFRTLTRILPPFALVFTAAGVVLTVFTRLENYTRLQPMRSLHLMYVIFFLLLGGLLGEYALRGKAWRWLALFVPLSVSMWMLQVSTYPASAHVEWPGVTPSNSWGAAFLWVRNNTPKDAVVALDPTYMSGPGEDMHGFRALAERSTLADSIKDSGAVSLFPGLADEWKAEVRSTENWKHFQLADFERLGRTYPVTWFVMQLPRTAGLVCSYRNQAVAVCQLPSIAGR